MTREAGSQNALNVLLKILNDRVIQGSDSTSGFICGSRKAVCFQDAPLTGVCQNVFYEQKYREANKGSKTRYLAVGLAFPKTYVYAKGGRPVVYDKTNIAKQYLPKDQHWRIVNFDLDDLKNIIDWTHEREWRVPEEFQFELDQATVLLTNESAYHHFVKLDTASGAALMPKLNGLVVMSRLLF
ncbi:hypothetical protein [Cyanobium sp. Morenito 9A2]|uniref:hypothetical protein n=1 Tax=Cyanobium sp. Morenito 9A2 TaxID=2823718 RepID=UPI0020CDCA77|nr:hypothetical protein [Cyanobium sp. Morenito 9A2]MCP9850206.1 hypothetical protein [Cyanobium sp. Morenito 9A2]